MTDAQGHECCPCVERLRRQNKASSDAWTRRTAKIQSRHDSLEHLMQQARDALRPLDRPSRSIFEGDAVLRGMSLFGQAVVAAAIDEANQAKLDAQMLRDTLADERRARQYAQSILDERTRADARKRRREEDSQALNEDSQRDDEQHSASGA